MSQQPKILAQLLEYLDDAQAQEVKTIDVHQQTTVTDYMVIATGRSSRQVKSIALNVVEKMKAAGFRPLADHGLDTGDWVLIDFNEVILHVMQADARAFYNLEGLWGSESA